MKTGNAFTLIELLIVIIVISLIAAVGIPTYRSFSQNSKSELIATILQSSIQLARSEAMARNRTVTICSINSTQNGCDTTAGNWTTGWTNGWLIYEDVNTNSSYDSGTDTLMKVFQPYGQGSVELVVKNSSATAIGAISFNSSGFPATASQGATFAITPTGCTGNNKRTLTLNSSGYIQLATAACP
jgi:type IV fimbrial biogenesis protein FimT